MSSRARAVNLAIAAVIAVVAVVAILATSGGDDAPEREATATPAATAEPREQARQAATPKPEPTPQPVPVVRYKGGEVVGGVETIEVDEGDRVRFDVVSDVEEEIHVHAYDLYYDLIPGKPAQVAFEADITGVIEVELHGAGAPLAELRVTP